MPLSTLLLAALAFFAVGSATVSFILMWEWWRQRARRGEAITRLGELANDAAATSAPGLVRSTGPALPDWLRAVSIRVPHLRDVETTLRQGGITWTVQTYLAMVAGTAFAFGFTTFVATRQPLTAMIVAAIAGSLPYAYVRHRRTKRLDAFESLLPESIDLLGRAIRAGHPLSAGIKMVADEAQSPVGEEFQRVFEEQRYGLPFDDTLLAMSERVPLVDVRILVTAILVQRQVGGNLAEILDSLSYTVRARFTLRRQIRTHTAQGRLSGYVLGALPIVVGVGLFALNPEYMLTLFHDPLGKFMVGIGLVLQLLGYLWIRRIVNIEI